MYHCHIHFYLTGEACGVFDSIKVLPVQEHFTHEFSESRVVEKALVEKADVILANLQNMEVKKTLGLLLEAKSEKAELIVLAAQEQMTLLTDSLSMLKDIWLLPMQEEEIHFRLLRWQQTYQMSKDFWEASHFLDSTINYIPSLIWYKDKNGIHEKVNDSFCKTVNKTKKQVEGRGHAYIWDVEQDDPACIESERIVMEKRETCISEEIIKTGEGMKQLTTYKSPLYNLDGSVMGTVGEGVWS